MKSAIAVIVLALVILGPCVEAKNKQAVKIEIAAPSEDRAFKFQGGGIIGLARGTRTEELVFMVNAVINGDHARLKCDENHRGCTALGPGVYDGEIQGNDVWITIVLPLTHKTIQNHWKSVGSW